MDDVTLVRFTEQGFTDSRIMRSLIDRLPAMIAYWDRDANNVVANVAYIEWFGFHPDQMNGRHISEVLGPEVYRKNLSRIEGALAGEVQLFDQTLVDQTGERRHTQTSYVPDCVDGEIHGFFVLVTDVTRRVEAQAAMDQAQSLAKLGSWELEPATRDLTWTQELFNILDLDPEDGPPALETLFDRIHPADRTRVWSHVERAVATGVAYTNDYRIVRSDGSVREVVSHANPVLGPEGEVVRLIGTLQDVTEANQLERLNRELRRANELNADVIAMLGHDIRSPLGAVQGFLELLDADWSTLSEDERHELVSRARGSTQRLGAMVDGIVALATIDSAAVNLQLEQLELSHVIPEVLETSGMGGRVSVDFQDPAATGLFDRVHLEQILGNLLSNAVRYGAEPIKVAVRVAGGDVIIAVTDAGNGVEASQTDQLFTRFARTGTRQLSVGGTGFGLYMAAKLAEANGGNLEYLPQRDDQPHEFALTMPMGDPVGTVE